MIRLSGRLAGTVLCCVLLLVSVVDLRAQEAVWNLRSPDWDAIWPTVPQADEARHDLITAASQLVGYSGQLLPVQPVGGTDVALLDGHVPVNIAWLSGSPAELAFGLARGWGHVKLGHAPLAFSSSSEELSAWRMDARYAPEEEAAADMFAAQFLADFGYDPAPLFATMCAMQMAAPADDPNDYGARVGLAADSIESVLGLRPETPCGPRPAMAELGSCSDRHDACLLDMERGVGVCRDVCRNEECGLDCGSGSYDLCESCMTSCTRRCNRDAALAFDQCEDDLDLCELEDDDG